MPDDFTVHYATDADRPWIRGRDIWEGVVITLELLVRLTWIALLFEHLLRAH